MPMLSQPHADVAVTLDPTTRLGHVHLTVNQLDRVLPFYTQVLGMTLHHREATEAVLGTPSEVLLRLTEDPAARRFPQNAGMYHFAVLYPSRLELARAVARLFALRYPNAPTDHGTSQTTYLDDPEGNNIELYVRTLDAAAWEFVNERPIVRYADGRIGSGRDPLDLEDLFRELGPDDRLDLPLPDGAQIGHVHLYAAAIDTSLNFYAGVLGFQSGMVSSLIRMGDVGLDDRQPHVIAFNTWKGEGIRPAPPGALGMRYFTVVLPDAAELQSVLKRVHAAGLPIETTPEGALVRDPSGIAVVLTDKMFALP